jgi:hypothetical protein
MSGTNLANHAWLTNVMHTIRVLPKVHAAVAVLQIH